MNVLRVNYDSIWFFRFLKSGLRSVVVVFFLCLGDVRSGAPCNEHFVFFSV